MDKNPRLRVLVLTRNYPPLTGGMERLVWNATKQLAKRAEVHVIAPEGSAGSAPSGVSVQEVPLKPLWRFMLNLFKAALGKVPRFKPDIVMAGSGLLSLQAYVVARIAGARCVTYVHGLDVAVENKIYRIFWLWALRHMDRVVANSSATRDLALVAGVSPSRIGIVHPGVQPVPSIRDMERIDDVRKEIGLIQPGPLLLSVGRLTERKGLREFVYAAMPDVVRRHPNATLLIVGDAPSEALYAKAQTRLSIQEAANQVGVAHSLRFLGNITDYNVLSRIYHLSDVHVFPVRQIAGDPEGFGMVAIEAAAHGLPTVAFATGGTVDAVAHGRSGCLVESGNYGEFINAINQVLSCDQEIRKGATHFSRNFHWDRFGDLLWRELKPDSTA